MYKDNYVGYARVSSKGQHLSRQITALENNGVKPSNIYREKVSGATIRKRPRLKKLLKDVNKTNVVVVLALDRLGRNAKDIKNIINIIKSKGATLEVLNLPSFKDVKNSNLRALLDDLIIDIYSYQAEAERKEIRARQKQGIKEAKKNGVYKHSTSHPKFTLKGSSSYLKTAFEMYSTRDKNGLSVAKIASMNHMCRSTLEKKLRKYDIKDPNNLHKWRIMGLIERKADKIKVN